MRESAVETIRRLSRPMRPQPTGLAPRLPPLPGLRAVIFDIYGTLLISGSGDVGTLLAEERGAPLAAALREAGLSGRIEEAAAQGVARFHAAIRTAHAASRAAGTAFPEVEVRTLWAGVLRGLADEGLLRGTPDPEAAAAVAVGYEARVNPVWPMPGAGRTIRSLARRRIPLGIVSNAQFYTPLFFEALLGGRPEALGFDPALCAWSWALAEAKPSPRLFAPVREALARRGIAPAGALYVGNDLRNDVAAAAAAGFRTALFAGDRRSLRLRAGDPAVRGVEPDAVLTAWPELDRLLSAHRRPFSLDRRCGGRLIGPDE